MGSRNIWQKAVCLFIWCTLFNGVPATQVQEVGNHNFKASKSGVEVPGVTFLMDDAVLTEGVLFAYSAFFRSDEAIRFQVWRFIEDDAQSENAGKHFRLIGETKVIPSVTFAREDVYIASKLTEKCVKVQTGDRLGVYLEGAPGAVAYTFDPANPMALGHLVGNGSAPAGINDTVRFDRLTFPYDFSMTAYLDKNLSRYSEEKGDLFDCPHGLWIPSYVKPTLPPTVPPTGRPGVAGSTGPQGIVGVTGQIGAKGQGGETGPDGKPGADGPTGLAGEQGEEGPGGTAGGEGPQGPTGAEGPRGEKGEQGDIGPAGPPGPSVYVDENGVLITPKVKASVSEKSDTMIYLIILAWLIIATIIVIAILIYVLVKQHRDKYPRERLPSAGSDFKPSWMDTLKEDDDKEYDQETMKSNKSSGNASLNKETEKPPLSTAGDRTSVPGYLFRPNSQHTPSFQYDSETMSSIGSSKNTEQTHMS